MGTQAQIKNPVAKERTRDISDYMLKFEYDEKADGSLNLVVKFEANKINALIKILACLFGGHVVL